MKTVRSKRFVEDWIVVKPGEDFDDCLFEDCILTMQRAKGVVSIRNSTFVGCTFVGSGWPPEFKRSSNFPASRADEPEVIEARVSKSIRPAPRQRRSFFN